MGLDLSTSVWGPHCWAHKWRRASFPRIHLELKAQQWKAGLQYPLSNPCAVVWMRKAVQHLMYWIPDSHLVVLFGNERFQVSKDGSKSWWDGDGVHESKICSTAKERSRAKRQPEEWEEIFDEYTRDRDRYLNSVENATGNHQKPNNPINRQVKKQSITSQKVKWNCLMNSH